MKIIPITALPRHACPSLFLTDRVPLTSLQRDPRFLYAAYIPDTHYPSSPTDPTKLPVLVAVHGTSRRADRCLDAWRPFALQHRCAVIAPLFPSSVTGPTDLDAYHYLGRQLDRSSSSVARILDNAIDVSSPPTSADPNPRHDKILLAILDEVAIRWPALDTSRFLLAGFSGGGQFAHRFMYLHPERLLGVSVGAPGMSTKLDASTAWPAGVADVESVFGQHIDVEAVRRVPVQASVGADDGVSASQAAGRLLVGQEVKGGRTRVEQLEELVEQWRELGMDVEFEIVPGAGHDMVMVNVVVEPFMKRQIARYWDSATGSV